MFSQVYVLSQSTQSLPVVNDGIPRTNPNTLDRFTPAWHCCTEAQQKPKCNLEGLSLAVIQIRQSRKPGCRTRYWS